MPILYQQQRMVSNIRFVSLENWINNIPRNVLDFKTEKQRFIQNLAHEAPVYRLSFLDREKGTERYEWPAW
jgi:hypothetical protein